MLGIHLGIPDDIGVFVVPVVQAANVGLDHADTSLSSRCRLHKTEKGTCNRHLHIFTPFDLIAAAQS